MKKEKAVKSPEPPATGSELAVVAPPPMIIEQAKAAAQACKEIVLNTAVLIKGKKHVCVEGWEAIAVAHGCFAGAGDSQRVIDENGKHIGYKASGYVRNGQGVILATGEGFVGFDEVDRNGHSTWGSRAEYAGRAMAQTRAISRACRSCFAHIVVFIDKKLDATPAEEMGHEPVGHERSDEPEPSRSSAERKPTHTRTRPYEEATVSDDKEKNDLAQLEAWMNDSGVPEGFVLAMLKERKLVAANLTKIANAPPGVIRRTLASRERLLMAYKASDASGDEPKSTEKRVEGRTVDGGGWTMRKPVQTDLQPSEMLAQEGVENWREVFVHVDVEGCMDKPLGKLSGKQLHAMITTWTPVKKKGKWTTADLVLDAALVLAHMELAKRAKEGNGGR